MTLDLRAFAEEHVCYEVEMLIGTSRMLSPQPRSVADNAMLESFLVHARLLDDFLTLKVPKPGSKFEDDVVAGHYIMKWTPRTILTEADRDLVNKFVAHLTSGRMTKEPVPVLALRAKVLSGFQRFLAELPPAKRPWFDRAAETLIAAAAPMPVTTASTTSPSSVMVVGGFQGTATR